MKINTKEIVFIPEFEGNRDLPEDEQLRMIYWPRLTVGGIHSLKEGFDETLKGIEYEKQLVTMIVKGFENFDLNDRLIKRGHEIYDDDVPTTLFTELRGAALRGYLNTELEKNSEEQSPSISTSEETNTTAKVVQETSS